jgi:predicted RNA-binding Zn-ribbon protein involved in translation (DUF1610 family)
MANHEGVICLSCGNCGAGLQIPGNLTEFACGSCGVQQSVRREGGAVFLTGTGDAIDRIQESVEKTAAELAYRRLSEEYQEAASRLSAIRAKARSKCDFPIAMTMVFCGPFALFGIFALFFKDSKFAVVGTCLAIGLGGFLALFLLMAVIRRRVGPSIARLEEEKTRLAGKLLEQRNLIEDWRRGGPTGYWKELGKSDSAFSA